MDRKLAESSKILIVDDHVLAHGYMRYSLEELRFKDISYEDRAHQALRLIQENHYDLIICSYNLKKEHDGYHLYDKLKNGNILSPRTGFIFISADTSADIVHSIVELQPDDFMAKPFTVKDLDRRLTKVLTRKKALSKIYQLIEQEAYEQALEAVDEFLSEPSKAQFFPLALKTKGDLLLACGHIEQAKAFYQAILNVQDFGWAQVGLVNTLIQLNEDDEAEKQILQLAFKPDSQLIAFDLLSNLNIKQEDFEAALESVVMATEISPRNIHRHHKVVDLSRITHDYETLFEAAKKIVKFSKDSIHDKPQNYLNVARAGIDFAMAADDEMTSQLIKQSSEYLRQAEVSFPKAEISGAAQVINARLLYLQNEKEKARIMIERLDEYDLENNSMDDLLDKAKAYHELGMYDRSQNVLSEIESRCQQIGDANDVFTRYIKQEKAEREQIRQTPKELNNSAVTQYQKGDLDQALETFKQAFVVMPKSTSIALNMLQALAMKAKDDGLPAGTQDAIHNCIHTIENGHMNEEQLERYRKVKGFIEEAI